MTFTHSDQGTPEQEWAGDPTLAALPGLDLGTPAHVVVVAAHPDDETLGAGGLIAVLSAAGARVDVVVATAGEASHPGSSTTTPEQLAAVREREVREAVRHLAPGATVHLLGLPDGRLGDHTAPLEQVLDALVGPATLLVAPWREDAHPDHEAAGAAAATVASARGARLLEYPVWAWHWGRPGDPRLPWADMLVLRLPGGARVTKLLAMGAHVSQTQPLSPAPGDEVLLSPAVTAHFTREHEVFVQRTDHLSMTGADFDRFYAGAGDDPWGFTDRWYEQRKRALTLAALPRERFGRAFEPGCSIGVLTELLAGRCDELLATDVAEAALAAARERTRHLPHVRVEQGAVPAQWPAGEFDLVVLSEVGYYSGPDDLLRLARRAAASLRPDGVLLACHWRHPVQGYPTSGDEVHRVLRSLPGLQTLARHEEEDFLLDVLVPAPATSVARAGGLLR